MNTEGRGREALEKAIDAGFLLSGHPEPGGIVSRLPDETREGLKDLTSAAAEKMLPVLLGRTVPKRRGRFNR